MNDNITLGLYVKNKIYHVSNNEDSDINIQYITLIFNNGESISYDCELYATLPDGDYEMLDGKYVRTENVYNINNDITKYNDYVTEVSLQMFKRLNENSEKINNSKVEYNNYRKYIDTFTGSINDLINMLSRL